MSDNDNLIRQTLAVGLARDLYDKFVMGGWEPKDAYYVIEIALDAYASVKCMNKKEKT